MSQGDESAAIIAAINASFTTPRAFDFDTARTLTAESYVIVSVSRRYVPERRASGDVTVPGGRLMTRYVAKKVANVYALRATVTALLENKMLPLGGDFIGPFSFEADETVGPDDGYYSAADFWTY